MDVDDNNEKLAHDNIAELQKHLIEIGDRLNSLQGNKRQKTILERQFALLKQQLADKIMHLYGLEKYDSIIPIIKEQYAAD
jgi:hypothetical protein